jgi:nitrogen regulatory protein PII
MKLVVAIIKPHQLEAVTDALHDIDVGGVTITEVKGHGRQRGHTEVYRGGEYVVDYVPKIELKIIAKESEAEKIANTIVDTARTGKIGDGKVFIQSLEMVVRVRTGEIGDDAI